MKGKARWATLAGFGAILLWSSSIGFSRHLTEKLGFLAAGALCNLLAGALGTVLFFSRGGGRQALRKAAPLPTFLCGLFFVAYTVFFVAAVGLAGGRRQVLEVGIINYLWPALTLAFSIFLLGTRPGVFFPLGLLLGLAGCLVAMGFEGEGGLESLLANAGRFGSALKTNLASNALPALLSLANAVSWALYSNLTRRWLTSVPGGMVALFMLASGAVLAIPALASPFRPAWDWQTAAFLAAQVVGPGLAAYMFWERAMRWGSVTLVSSAAFLIPILFLAVSRLLLREAPTPWMWTGAVLVVAGAGLCKQSLREPPAAGKTI